jgi:predicted nucleic acid-binding protein
VPELWVINASPVILLAKAGVIHLLPRLCDQQVVPAGVVEEVAVGVLGDAGRAWLAKEGAVFVRDTGPLPDQLRDAELGHGEAEVIAWALLHRGFKAVLDDKRGRFWAKRLGAPVIGSLGAVVLMKQRGLISTAAPVLQRIRSAGAYVNETAIRAALVQAGES